MKKYSLVLAVIIIISTFSLNVYSDSLPYETNSSIFISGKLENFSSPVINYNDRTMVPMRELFEKLGIKIEWVEDTSSIIITTRTKILTMQLNNNLVAVEINKDLIYTITDTKPILYKDKTYVPLRFVCEQLNLKVEWSESENSINLVSNGNVTLGNYKTSTTDIKTGLPMTVNYKGELVNGVPQGMGVCEYKLNDGTTINGKGFYEKGICKILYYENDEGEVYVGPNQTNGFCYHKYSGGYYYIGNVNSSAQFEGYVEIYIKSGTLLYAGNFLDGTYNGYGECYYENGSLLYAGELKNGKYDGKGTYYDKKGTIRYSGNFKEGTYCGYGECYYENGGIMYLGEFKDNKYNGYGKFYDINGKLIYEGGYKDGVLSGSGKLYDDNGQIIYEGEYENGESNGYGKLYDEQGNILYEGYWENGEMSNKVPTIEDILKKYGQ